MRWAAGRRVFPPPHPTLADPGRREINRLRSRGHGDAFAITYPSDRAGDPRPTLSPPPSCALVKPVEQRAPGASYRNLTYQTRARCHWRILHFRIIAYYRLRVVLSQLDGMNLERSFGYLLHDVARLFARRFNRQALLLLGLNRSQCRVLGYLARYEGINQAGLADLLEIKPMTLVRQIDRMEADGWIERRPDPGDRRAHRLMLTEKARPLLARILDLSTEIRQEAFVDLSEEEGRHLIDLLRRVHAGLSGHATIPSLATLPEPAGFPDGQPSRERADAGLAALGSSR